MGLASGLGRGMEKGWTGLVVDGNVALGSRTAVLPDAMQRPTNYVHQCFKVQTGIQMSLIQWTNMRSQLMRT